MILDLNPNIEQKNYNQIQKHKIFLNFILLYFYNEVDNLIILTLLKVYFK